MMSRLVGKIVCHGCSRSVCSSSKATTNETALQRYDYKMDKSRRLAEYLAKKKCTYRFVGGMGEFRGNILPRSCAAHWAEFDQRMMAFDSCSEVARDDSSLSAAIWGLGDTAVKAAHASLNSFMTEILYLLHTAYNGNSDIQEMLQKGDCTLNLNILHEEMQSAQERMEQGGSLEDSLKAVDHRVFGPNCDFEKAKMPWMYLRMRLLKSIRTMVHGIVEHLVHGSEDMQVETLLTNSMDESSANDDPNVAAAENTLLNGDSKEDKSFQPPDEDEGTSLVELGSEPVVTTTGVLVGTGIIVAALVGGFAVLAVIGLVLRALMMTRRITFKDRTTA